MRRLFRLFLDICLLRAGPQELPASGGLLILALGSHWGIGTLHGFLNLSPGNALFAALLSTLTAAAVVQGLLALRGFPKRLFQTLTALAGCEVLLGLFAFPVSALLYSGEPVAALLILLLIGWNLLVSAHILRHALEIPFGLALAAGFTYTVVSYSVVDLAIGNGV